MLTNREFATQVTQKLQAAGYAGLFAGGCVRDDLLGKTPKDYDVATNATPDQVRELFGHKRTLAIGASFGVITVLGPKPVCPIEIATFRRDGGYSDGRRPDSIEFTDAKEDALRRDFTINGMFFDPISEKVIDYVGGQEDLQRRQIRAIGNAQARIDEDKLRMLRGVRFAATYDFSIEPDTMIAIQKRAAEISVVSPERIGAEVRKMFSRSCCANGFRLLLESTLWGEILPESLTVDPQHWQSRLTELEQLQISGSNNNAVAAVVSLLLRFGLRGQDGRHEDSPKVSKDRLNQLKDAWKLSNELTKSIGWVVDAMPILAEADRQPWSKIQPWLIDDDVEAALDVVQVIDPEAATAVKFSREKRLLSAKELDPDPLVTGQDLIEMGIYPGPDFKTILQSVRDGQLDGELVSREDGLAWVEQHRS